jgi:hypothetical protein
MVTDIIKIPTDLCFLATQENLLKENLWSTYDPAKTVSAGVIGPSEIRLVMLKKSDQIHYLSRTYFRN